MSSEYQGRRLGDNPQDKADADYDARHLAAQQNAAPGGLFYDPFSAYASLDPDEEDLQNEGEAFNVKKGRHEALLEGVFSSEIDGGVIETLTPKKKRGPLITAVSVVLIVLIGVVFFVFMKEPAAPTSNSNAPSLVSELEETYPNLAFTSTATTYSGVQKGFKSSSGSTLKSPYAATLLPDDCRLSSNSSFCAVGTIELPTLPGARVFSSNALISSPTFAELLDFTSYSAALKAFKGQAVVNFGDVPTRFLLFMDGSKGDGWFVEVPTDSTPEQVKALSDSFTYAP